MCKCVLYFCHRVKNQLQLTNISYHIITLIVTCQGATWMNYEKNLGNNLPLCQLIISNPIHTNTTPEQYTLVYYYFPATCFCRTIRPSSVTVSVYAVLPSSTWWCTNRTTEIFRRKNNNKRTYIFRVLCLCGLDLLWQKLSYNMYRVFNKTYS